MKSIYIVIISIVLSLGSYSVAWAGLVNKHWVVKSGDTLYAIARAVYPKSVRSQAKLRKDIVKLNRRVFAKGAKGISVGDKIKMPGYVFKTSTVAKKKLPKRQTSAPVKLADPKKIVTKSKQTAKTATKPSTDNKRPSKNIPRNTVYNKNSNSNFSSDISLNFGYSVGGDNTPANTQGGHDITFGSGGHLRLSYDGLWRHTQGFRISLGYQYDKVTAGSDSAQLSAVYLQAMYLYNITNSLLGVGVTYLDGISFDTDIAGTQESSEYRPKNGILLMYEYKKLFGSHIAGISHTVIESESVLNQSFVDSTRTELYYRLEF